MRARVRPVSTTHRYANYGFLNRLLKGVTGSGVVVTDSTGKAASLGGQWTMRGGLVALGVAATDIDLVKPADTNDRIDSLAQARRVDVTIVDGPVPEGEAATEPTPP